MNSLIQWISSLNSPTYSGKMNLIDERDRKKLRKTKKLKLRKMKQLKLRKKKKSKLRKMKKLIKNAFNT